MRWFGTLFRAGLAAQNQNVDESEHDAMPDVENVDKDADEHEPHDVPFAQCDASAEDPLRNHSPRSLAEILGISSAVVGQ